MPLRLSPTWITDVLSVVLTGLSTASSAVVSATDTILVALGKLQAQVTLRAPIASPGLTGVPTAPSGTQGTNTTQLATCAYVYAATANTTNLATTGGSTTLTATQYGVPIIVVTGTLISNATLVVPVNGRWTICNRGTGAFTLTVKTPSGTGVVVDQGFNTDVIADGVNVVFTHTDFNSVALQGNSTAPTPTYGDSDTSIPTTAFVQAAVAPALNDYGRNLIHNPLFNIQQRGAGPFTSAFAMTADRWFQEPNVSTYSATLISLADADRTAIGDEAAIYAYQCVSTGTAGAPDYLIGLEQKIENVRLISGKTITLSFYAKATSGTPKVGLELTQDFGSGGSPSTRVSSIGVQAVTLSTTWTRYTATIAIPSASGKTFGTTVGTDFTGLRFWQSSGASNNTEAGGIGVQSFTLQVWGVQVEIAANVSPVEKRPVGLELALCQRFFQVVCVTARFVATGVSQISNDTVNWPPMRVTPTASLNTAGTTNLVSTSTLYTQATNGGRYEIVASGSGDCYSLAALYNLVADL